MTRTIKWTFYEKILCFSLIVKCKSGFTGVEQSNGRLAECTCVVVAYPVQIHAAATGDELILRLMFDAIFLSNPVSPLVSLTTSLSESNTARVVVVDNAEEKGILYYGSHLFHPVCFLLN